MLNLEHGRLSFAVLYLVAHNHLDRPVKRDFFNIEELVLVKVLMCECQSLCGIEVDYLAAVAG